MSFTLDQVRAHCAKHGLQDLTPRDEPPPLPKGPSPWERQEEAKIHRAIMDWLNQQGWGDRYLRARMDKRSPFPEGWPDFTVFLPGGLTVFLEVKTPTGKVSAEQAKTLAMLDGAGFATCVPHSDIAAIEWIKVQAEISVADVLQPAQDSPAGT